MHASVSNPCPSPITCDGYVKWVGRIGSEDSRVSSSRRCKTSNCLIANIACSSVEINSICNLTINVGGYGIYSRSCVLNHDIRPRVSTNTCRYSSSIARSGCCWLPKGSSTKATAPPRSCGSINTTLTIR